MIEINMGGDPRCFDHIVKRVRNRHCGELTILEIGCWLGRSLIAWDRACDGLARFIAVDKWEPYLFKGESDFPYDEVNRQLATGEAKKTFDRNIAEAGLAGRIEIFQEDSSSALRKLEQDSRSVHIAFIDGDHKYDAVCADIMGSFPLIKDGGILCGHDLNKQMNEVTDIQNHIRAVTEGVDNMGGYNPGVTQAVWDTLGLVESLYGFWIYEVERERD